MLAMFPDDSKAYLERLARNADRLYALISDLLDVTRLEIGILKFKFIYIVSIDKININNWD